MSDKPKFSSGEWNADYKAVYGRDLRSSNGKLIASIWGFHEGPTFATEEEFEANSALLKTAPKLYRACIKALKALDICRNALAVDLLGVISQEDFDKIPETQAFILSSLREADGEL